MERAKAAVLKYNQVKRETELQKLAPSLVESGLISLRLKMQKQICNLA